MFNEHITMFTDYLKNATFAAFTARARGEYDWIDIKYFQILKSQIKKAIHIDQLLAK